MRTNRSPRSRDHLCIAAILLATAGSASAQEAAHDHASRPEVRAAYLDEVVTIDGRLDERVWGTAPAATDFVQMNPDEGEPATQRTEVRFAVDGSALYIGARMYDTEGAAGVRGRLTRRDQLNGDYLEFVLDTFHDHAGRTRFAISPAGVKFDAGQASPFADSSWDPVWESAVLVDSIGWTAEMRIPLSQLRFPRDSVQTWGLQVWRFVERLNEESMWAPWGRTDSGGPARFGHLTDIRMTNRMRTVELLPYVTMRASYVTPTQPGSPFQRNQDYGARMGGEVKALLTSTLALDATINPDFGQVEVDPAVVNLSAFETFLQEKRPFFVEGSGLFGFGGLSCYFCNNASGMSLFYSRRIGRRPQGSISTPARYSDIPDNTGILGAVKVTGRTEGGFQVGLLNAVTRAARADVVGLDGERLEQEVEPLTNYMVGRVRKTFLDGDVTIGAIGTSVVRRFGEAALESALPSRAESAGLDWSARMADQNYSLDGNIAFSNVTGDPTAVRRLQESSARYFQRPDRPQGSNRWFSDSYDPAASSLRGFGGYTRLAKVSGDWLWETTVNLRSPGFEVNDLAYLTSADYIWTNANLARQWQEPTRYYRRIFLLAGGQQQYNFDRDLTNREFRAYGEIQFPNYWWFEAGARVLAEAYDDRLTRGGPVVKRPRGRVFFASAGTDSRRAFTVSANPYYYAAADGSSEYGGNLNLRYRPVSNVSISLSPRFGRNEYRAQFVRGFSDATATHFGGRRVVFGELSQQTVGMDTRVSMTFTPNLTLELFAQPLLSSGSYSRFKEFTAPRSREKAAFGPDRLTPIHDESGRVLSYSLDADRDPGTPAFTFDNPDYNLQSLRGNAVLRWEFRPGSTLFLVWQQSRAGNDPIGEMNVRRDATELFQREADNVFVMKVSYWFGR